MSHYFSKIIEFDKNKYQIIQELSYIDNDVIEFVESLLTSQQIYSFSAKGSHKIKDSFTDKQRKKWFVYISQILSQQNPPVMVSPETIHMLDNQLRLSYLPCNTATVGEKEIPVPPSLARGANKIITEERMEKALQQIRLDYSEMGIDFDRKR